MTDTSLNPSGAGFFNAIANGAVRQQYVVDPQVSGDSPIGTVMEIEPYAGPGDNPRAQPPLIQPSSTSTPGGVIGALSPGTDLGSTLVPPGAVATVTISGVCQVLCDSSTVSGDALIQSPSTPGCAQTSNSPTTRTLGLCLQSVTISSGTALVWCYIDPGTQSGSGGGGGGVPTLNLSYAGTGPITCQVIDGLNWDPTAGGNLFAFSPNTLGPVPGPAFCAVDGTGTILGMTYVFFNELIGYDSQENPTTFVMNGLEIATLTTDPGNVVNYINATAGMVAINTATQVFWYCVQSYSPSVVDAIWIASGTGPQGAQGAQGDTGATGPQGSPGSTGAQGPQGIQGSQGTQGAMGPQGSQGTQGNQGPQGYQGVQGTQGVQGQSDHYQTTSSTSLTIGVGTQTLTVATGLSYTVGQSAVIAFDSLNYMVGTVTGYTSGTGVLVVLVTTIVGAGSYSSWIVNLDGATGVQGAQGTQGNQGSQGNQGNQGNQGTQGVQGAQGTQGVQGSIGNQGNQGNQGSPGSVGAQGNQGSPGTPGGTGPQGPQGYQGTNTGSLTPDAITATVTGPPNTVTVPNTYRVVNVQNGSAAALQLTLATASATDGWLLEVRIYDYSNVAQVLTWVNTENAAVTVPTSSNGSTTLPLSVLFQFNNGGTAGGTSKWRCLSVS